MAQSPEYPDLRWVPPRAFGRGRDGKAVRFIVIHYTAGSERATSAEDGAAYDQRRTDGTSTHYFVDRDSVVQCVATWNRANTARHRGNRLGIQYELCGTVQTRAQWLDAASRPTLQRAARQVARDCRKYGIPVRRLSVAETRRAWTDYPDGPRGIVGHVDCTYAFPEDGGDHTDPGTHFPWDVFLDMVRAEMEAPVALTAADVDAIWNDQTTIPGTSDVRSMRDLVRYLHSASKIAELSAAAVLAALAGAEGKPLYELAQEVQKIRDDLMILMSDPADSSDPEGHPIVMAIRYANANPPA